MGFCWFKHEWIEHNRHFYHPKKNRKQFSKATMSKLADGYTVITFKCYRCGAWKTKDAAGDVTS